MRKNSSRFRPAASTRNRRTCRTLRAQETRLSSFRFPVSAPVAPNTNNKRIRNNNRHNHPQNRKGVGVNHGLIYRPDDVESTTWSQRAKQSCAQPAPGEQFYERYEFHLPSPPI